VRFPLLLDLAGKPVLVVGGGDVAHRRARALAEAGAQVMVVAPTIDERIAANPGVVTHQRPFHDDDVAGTWLVFACTDDADVNAAVDAAARRHGVWCSRADDAQQSSAWVPATGAVDDVQVTVSAGGDPVRARELRDGALRALHAGEWFARRGRRSGRVTLVGGGPGDPGLLTLAGYRALLDADVVVVDRLAPTELLASLPTEVEVVDVGKDPRGRAAAQDDINALLVTRARDGQSVVRLKGGDPFVLGRGTEEVDACVAADVPVSVIPGLTSATAAATVAGVPLTERGTAQLFSVVSGHVPPGDPRSTVDWDALARTGGTLVLLMAVANLGAIATSLVAAGRSPQTPATVVENATLPQQRVLHGSLADVAELAAREGVEPPAVVIVGEVAGARRQAPV
jgi:uroporphyrin-III C-methyltransferase / precorrin-2 dehydrogenase / sirohydrochlorin ferrochelatase